MLVRAIAIMKLAMLQFQREHCAFKFQIAATIVYHKAVVTQTPIILASEMVSVYADCRISLKDMNRELLH